MQTSVEFSSADVLEEHLFSEAERKAKENIRVIGIYLQDQQTAAVVRGKISKKKLVKVS